MLLERFLTNIYNEILYESSKKQAKKAIDNYKKVSLMISDEFKTKRSGLLIGKVQSGKTNSFIAVMSHLLDFGLDAIVVFSGTKIDLNEQTKKRITNFFKSIKGGPTIISKPSDLVRYSSQNEFTGNKKIVLVIKKTRESLQALFKNIALFDRKLLIIDDEADHASQDNNISSKKQKSSSPTNKTITDIISYENVNYLGVTATPQIQLLVNMKAALKPEFVVFTKPGEEYYGLEYFHDGNFRGIYKMGDLEVNKIKNDLSGAQTIKHSIFIYLLTFYKMFVIDKISDKYPAMLINTSSMIISHKKMKNKINGILSTITKDELKKSFDSISQTVNRIIGNNSVEDAILWIEKVTKGSSRSTIRTIMVNSEGNFDKVDDVAPILIGGEKLSRGLTIDNLVTVLFLREPKTITIDTTLQRARWFGYRKKTVNYLNIFTSERIARVFEQLKIHEEHLWSQEGADIDNFNLLISKTMNIIPTRKSAASPINMKLQYTNPIPASIKGEESFDSIMNFMNGIKTDDLIKEKEHKFLNNIEHVYYKISDIIRIIDQWKLYENVVFSNIDEILRLIQENYGDNKIVRVSIMRNGNIPRKRSSGKHFNLFQGSSPKGAVTDDEKTYCGDQYLYNYHSGKNNYVGEIQLHDTIIKGVNSSTETIFATFKSIYLIENFLKAHSKRLSER